MAIQCNHLFVARKSDIVVIEQNKTIIVDMASLWNHKVNEEENKKVEEYQELKREIRKLWRIKHAEVILVDVGTLGAVSRRLDVCLEKLGITI